MSRLGFGFALVVAFGFVGCGGSSGGNGDNDQGIVFTATGIFRGLEQIESDSIRCTEPTIDSVISDTAFTLSIGTVVAFPDRNNPFGDPCGGYIGLQNNLLQLPINVQEVVITYDIPGAGIPLPTNSVTFNGTIPPSSSTQETSSGQPNLVYTQLNGQIVPRPVIVFLNQNANRLPATPYLMNVFMVAKGQSQNGTRYTSNEIGYTLTIVP